MTKLQQPSYTRAEQIADMTVHAIGVFGALLAVPVMITLAAVWDDEGAFIAAVAVYGASILVMLGMSAGYNFSVLRRRGGRLLDWMRRADHAAIYVKIAGTYTPYAVLAGGPVGRWLLIGVWAGALLGLMGKLFAPHKWERASIVLYLALGWLFVVAAGPITDAIATGTLVLMFVGGGLYTVGVIFHLWRTLPYQNAIWHLFVLLATFVFYSAIVVETAMRS